MTAEAKILIVDDDPTAIKVMSASDDIRDEVRSLESGALDRDYQGLRGIAREITDRKRVEDELRSTKEWLEAMLNALPDLMFRLDREGRIHDFRSSATEKLYLAPDLFLGKKVSEVLPADAALVIMDALEDAAMHGAHHGGTYSLSMPQGELWFEISVAAIGGAIHPGHAFVMLVRDITRRMQAEQAIQSLNAGLEQRVAERTAALEAEIAERQRIEGQLRVSEEMARRSLAEIQAYYDTAPVGLFVLDTGLRYLRINERLAAMNGQPVAAHLGRTVRELLPDLADSVEPLFRSILSTGRPLLNIDTVEETSASPSGKRYWRAHYYPLRNATGDIIGINGMAEDITDLQQAEQALRDSEKRYRQLSADLERQVQERTARLREVNAELHLLATTDALTGIWNRRHFEQVAATEIVRTQRYGEPLSLVLFDIDHFKSINDRYGHQTGDRVLVELTQLVHGNLRAADLLARWGGEEFVAMLPHCRLTDALHVAEKLRALVAARPVPDVGTVTASFGVAELLPHEGFDAWVKRVDDALYVAKSAGRNQVAVSKSRGDQCPSQ